VQEGYTRKLTSVIAIAVALLPGALVPLRADAVSVPEQTPVQVRLLQELKSGRERKGESVRMETASPVKGPDGTILIAQGTPVVGTITRSGGRGMFGKPGKLEFSIDYIKVDEKTRVPLRSTPQSASGRNNKGAAIATAVLLAPVAIFVKGREVTVKQGREFPVYVDATTELTPTSGAAGAVAPSKPDPSRLTVITLKSGLVLEGTVIAYKNGEYTLVTQFGQSVIPEANIRSITGAQVAAEPATVVAEAGK
jgi:hypothetical protein